MVVDFKTLWHFKFIPKISQIRQSLYVHFLFIFIIIIDNEYAILD